MPLEEVFNEEEIDISRLPDTYAQYKAMVSSQLEKRYRALVKINQALSQEPEFLALMNTIPSSADKVKRFDTTFEKAGRLLESFTVAVELLGTALLPETSLKMKYRAMVASKANKGIKDKLDNDEAHIERNVQILYNEAKDIAVQYGIPVELIDQYYANEDYVSMDKLIVKARKCKHGLRYNSVTGQVKCIRKREVQRDMQRDMQRQTQGEKPKRAPKPSCYQRRKDDCINTDHCTWEVGKRCKSKAKVEKDKKNTFVTHQNPVYNTLSPAPRNFGMVVDNPLYNRRSPLS
jgi:hypothetical protein